MVNTISLILIQVLNSEKRRKPAKVANTVSNAKERLLTRYDTDVKRDEIERIRLGDYLVVIFELEF